MKRKTAKRAGINFIAELAQEILISASVNKDIGFYTDFSFSKLGEKVPPLQAVTLSFLNHGIGY